VGPDADRSKTSIDDDLKHTLSRNNVWLTTRSPPYAADKGMLVHYQDTLESVIEEAVAPRAEEVDSGARYPRAQLDALAAEGLLALTVP
jgi:hypothetical protein